jgi:hypothetical protein
VIGKLQPSPPKLTYAIGTVLSPLGFDGGLASSHPPASVSLSFTAAAVGPATLESSRSGAEKSRERDIELQPLWYKDYEEKKQDTREERRVAKSREKFRELETREAMKFSHSVQFNAVPEWSSHYINYSNLKKL